MSGVPIREAIQRLAAEGILSIEHNVGARVAVFDGQAYRDGMESLAVMDGVATALAAQQISTADLERAEAYNDQIIALLDDFRSEEHTSELQYRGHLVCRLLLEKKKD